MKTYKFMTYVYKPVSAAKRWMHSAALHLSILQLFSGAIAVMAITIALWQTAPAFASPQGGHIVHGQGAITHHGNHTQVDTQSRNTIINYDKFNIAKDESVRFQQPDSSSRVLNRVLGNGGSRIAGKMSSNGIVYLVNQAGVYFSKTAQVNVAGLYAAAGNLSNENFLSHTNFFTNLSGQVINKGTIEGKNVSLLGKYVANLGSIKAPHGTITMLAGNSAYISKVGGNITIKIDSKKLGGALNSEQANPSNTGKAGVINTGSASAQGGRVTLGAGDIYSLAVNTSGAIKAHNIDIHGGKHGKVAVSGNVDASNNQGKGGNINISAGKIGIGVKPVTGRAGVPPVVPASAGNNSFITAPTTLDASGATGGGKILIGVKPLNSRAAPKPASSRSDDTFGGYTYSSAYTYISGTTTLDASATGFDLQSKAGFGAALPSNALADGGFIDTSGKILDIAPGVVVNVSGSAAPKPVNSSASNGLWLLDPADITIVGNNTPTNNVTESSGTFTPNNNIDSGVIYYNDIQIALNNNTNVLITTTNSGGQGTGNINVNAPLSWSASSKLTLNAQNDINFNQSVSVNGAGTLFLKYGQSSNNGSGSAYNVYAPINLDGSATFKTQKGTSGNLINWTIITSLGSESSTTGTDLQGINGNLSGNYVLGKDIHASDTANWNDDGSGSKLGFAPIGDNINSFTGTFDGLGHVIKDLTINRPTQKYVGLFGYFQGSIRNLGIINADVKGAAQTGILAGRNAGGNISKSFTSGYIYGTSPQVGGLVGQNSPGTIIDSFSTASVDSSSGNVGGLVGSNAGSISNSYATGAVRGSISYVGGLVGVNAQGTIKQSFFDTQTTGQQYGVGSDHSASGVTAGQFGSGSGANFSDKSTFDNVGWDITNSSDNSNSTWKIIDGKSYPYLNWQFGGATPQVINGTVYTDSGATNAGAGVAVLGSIDGNNIAAMTTGANGFYYRLLAPGSFDSSGSQVLVYAQDYGNNNINSATYKDGATGSQAGFDLYGNMFTAKTSLYSLHNLYTDAGNSANLPANFLSDLDNQNITATSTSGFNIDQNLNVNGNLFVTATAGAITQSNPISVSGTSSFDAGASNITLGNTGNDFKSVVNLTGGNTTITDADALALGTVNTDDLTAISQGALDLGAGTVNGALSATSNDGSITQDGALTIVGVSEIDAGAGSITLANTGNDFQGAVSLAGSDISLQDSNDLKIASLTNHADAVSLIAGGTLMLPGGEINTGTAKLTLASNGGLLETQGNLAGGDMSLTGKHGILLKHTINAGTLALTSSDGGIVQTGGTVTVTGASDIDAGYGAITLDNTGNDFQGAVSLSNTGANNVSINNNSHQLLLGNVSVGSGTLSLSGNGIKQAATSSIKQEASAGNVNIDGGAGEILLDSSGNAFTGAITLTTDSNITLYNSLATDLGASTIGGALDVTSDGAISQSGALQVGGKSSFDAGANDITLGNSANQFTGAVTLATSSDITITNNAALSITLNNITSSSNINLTTTNGALQINSAITANDLTLDSAGAIGDTNKIDVANFVLKGGTWKQIGSFMSGGVLPDFSATSFTIDPANSTFVRALSGDGTSAATAYKITDIYGLQGMASQSLLGDYFVLAKDIYASGTQKWNPITIGGLEIYQGFAPIGDSNNPFTGNFDGLDHTISDLYINRTGAIGTGSDYGQTVYVGLFGHIGGSAIENVGLIDASITGIGGAATGANSSGGDAYVGVLVGGNVLGTITNSYAIGTVTGTGGAATGINGSGGFALVGSLVGDNYKGTISNSYAAGTVTAAGGSGSDNGDAYIGGLVGENFGANGTIANSYATGTVAPATGADGNAYVGGLVGYNKADILQSYADGVARGNHYVGGLVGNNEGAISNSHATTSVIATGNNTVGTNSSDARVYAGGLVGLNARNSTIKNSYAIGTVTGTGGTATGTNSVGGDALAGGLVGANAGLITNSYATVAISGTGGTAMGANSIGGGDAAVGGLVGANDNGAEINNSYASGKVVATGSASTGANNAGGSAGGGGLVGINAGAINSSYATGKVTATATNIALAGGLVGENDYTNGTITNSYATGAVTGTGNNANAGGLVGANYGIIKQSYAAGAVSGNSFVGGLVGYNDSGATITANFFDTLATDQTNGVGGGSSSGVIAGTFDGSSGANLSQVSAYSSWNISATDGSGHVWRIYDGNTYPLLRTFLKPVTATLSNKTVTYNGTDYSANYLADNISWNNPSNPDMGHLFMATAQEAGTYDGTSLYSDQQGYDINIAQGSGKLTILPPLSKYNLATIIPRYGNIDFTPMNFVIWPIKNEQSENGESSEQGSSNSDQPFGQTQYVGPNSLLLGDGG